MKYRRACYLIFFLLSSKLSLSQILVGPVAGAQYSWVSFEDKDYKDLYKVKPVFGFNAGVGVSFLVRKRFFLHTSILYSTKGKVIEGKEDLRLKNKVTYHFIDVPIVYTVDFRGKLGGGKEFKYSFGVGPNIGYWLGGKGSISTTDLTEMTIDKQAYTIAFNKEQNEVAANEMGVADPTRVQLGLNLTAGIVFEPMPFRKLMLTARYEFGHSFFSRTSDGRFQNTYYLDILRSRNQGVRLSVAYLIDLQVDQRKKGKSTIKQQRRR